jgi:hypothetical protein
MNYSDQAAIETTLKELVEIAGKHPLRFEQDDAAAREFVAKHPWADKFLSVGFAEAEKFVLLAKGGLVEISRRKMPEAHSRIFPGRIVMDVTSGDYRFSFTFKQSGDEYVFHTSAMNVPLQFS